MHSVSMRAATIGLVLVLAGCHKSTHRGNDISPTSNSGLAVGSSYPSGMIAWGDFLVFLVSESEQGATDLNGDGDAADRVMHVLNTVNGATVNLGVAGSPTLGMNEDAVAWLMQEADQGGDFDGDGFLASTLLAFFYPDEPLGPTNPFISNVLVSPATPLQGSQEYFSYIVGESDLNGDVNGDTDLDDLFAGYVNSETLATNLITFTLDATAPTQLLVGNLLTFSVSEGQTGPAGTDLNGDADTGDTVLYTTNVRNGTLVPVGPGGRARAADPQGFDVGGTLGQPVIAFAIDETGENINLNGGLGADTDVNDTVLALFTFSSRTETIPGAGVAVQPLRIRANVARVAMAVPEAANGTFPVDLNADSDGIDVVPFWLDLTDPLRVHNVGVATEDAVDALFPQLCGNDGMIFLINEADQGPNGTNYNVRVGDQDTADLVVAYAQLGAAGTRLTNLGLAGTQAICSAPGDWMAMVAPESDNGEGDLNGDGDGGDEVLFFFPIAGGEPVNGTVISGEATSNSILIDALTTVMMISFMQEEPENRYGDFNGDGDTDDVVVTKRRIGKFTGEVEDIVFVGNVGPDEGTDSFPFAIGNSAYCFPALESTVGTGTNFNGDGDASDKVLFYGTFVAQ